MQLDQKKYQVPTGTHNGRDVILVKFLKDDALIRQLRAAFPNANGVLRKNACTCLIILSSGKGWHYPQRSLAKPHSQKSIHESTGF